MSEKMGFKGWKAKYNYKTSDGKSPSPKNIADDTVLAGVSVGDDTVRKHLKEASGLLPKGAEEPKN